MEVEERKRNIIMLMAADSRHVYSHQVPSLSLTVDKSSAVADGGRLVHKVVVHITQTEAF